jgi:hypothetical protein
MPNVFFSPIAGPRRNYTRKTAALTQFGNPPALCCLCNLRHPRMIPLSVGAVSMENTGQ